MYQPETLSGQRLLAHELTHVVQQSGHVQRKPIIQRWFGKTTAYGKIVSKLEERARLSARQPITAEANRNILRKIGKIITFAQAGARSAHQSIGTAGRRNAALEAVIDDVKYIRRKL